MSSPNTKKQKALRRIERAVGAVLPRDVYASLSMLRGVDIDAFAEWLEGVKGGASDEKRDSVVPIDDIDV